MKRQLRTETLSLVKRRAIIAQRFLSKVAAAIHRWPPLPLHITPSEQAPTARRWVLVRSGPSTSLLP